MFLNGFGNGFLQLKLSPVLLRIKSPVSGSDQGDAAGGVGVFSFLYEQVMRALFSFYCNGKILCVLLFRSVGYEIFYRPNDVSFTV